MNCEFDIFEYMEQKQKINFNPQQKEAIEKIDGSFLLLAVPGAGKTTVMVARIANMIYKYNVNPSSILTLTFSKTSAKDMELKYQRFYGELGDKCPHFSTIHSFSYSVIRYYCNYNNTNMPSLIEGNKNSISKPSLLRKIYSNLNHEMIGEDILNDLSSDISYVKNMMLKEEKDIRSASQISNFYKIYKEYQRFNKQNNLMDFDDMLIYSNTILRKYPYILAYYRNKYSYVNVDEAQDTSKIQHSIIRKLYTDKTKIFMVGDEDQSIYAFRGAYPKAILDFPKTYENGQILKMEENFRSNKGIIECANRFIKLNKDRHDKTMFTTSKNNITEKAVQNIILDKQDEQYSYILNFIKKMDTTKTLGILYRTNFSAISLIDILDKANISFHIREHKTSFQYTYAIADIINFIKLSFDENNYKAFSSVFYKTNCYLKRDFLDSYELKNHKGESILDELIELSKQKPDVHISKVFHAVKIIKKLKDKNPIDAIECILDDLGYLEFLKYISSFRTYSAHLQKISAFKNLARNCSTLEELLDRINNMDIIIKQSSKQKSNITLTTAHSAKGLEFDNVIIMDLYENIFPSLASIEEFEQDDSLIMEEARLFYVCVTRAKEKLMLLSSSMVDNDYITPSRFITRLIIDDKDKSFVDSLFVGMRIRHFVFGVGQIISISKKDNVAVIFFHKGGKRMLDLNIFDGIKVRAIENQKGQTV